MTASPPPTAAGAPGSDDPAPPRFPDAPPLTAFAWRHGLVRPVQGRTFAGVSGAMGRATNTDPVLWKVILVVLALFGGIGVMIYLLAWLLLPADGDTATPIEALGGRGQSRTTTVRTIIGLVIAALMLAGYVTEPYRATPLVAMVLLGGVLLVLLRDNSRGRGPASGPPPSPSPGPVPYTAAAPGASPPGVAPAGTAAPFAPQGPFAPPAPPMPPMPPPPVARWQPPPPPRPRSRLGQLTLSVAVLLLGAMVAADLARYDVPALAYFAVPLGVLGLGLLVGTWLGRARWLIPLGIVLMLALGGGYVALGDGPWRHGGVGVVELRPQSVDEISRSYERNLGAIELDLSDVDFAGTSTAIDIRVNLGAIEITVPSDVDVTVQANVDVGSAVVFDQSWDGVGAGSRDVTDLGADGLGGGELHVAAAVNTGALTIRRER